MEGMYVCLGALIIVAPLALLLIGIVQLHQLKASVRSLVRRVGELESRASGFVASPTPVGIFVRGVTTDVMTTLPLSLIPTFAVPLLMVLHGISIAQAARWQVRRGIETAHHTIQASLG